MEHYVKVSEDEGGNGWLNGVWHSVRNLAKWNRHADCGEEIRPRDVKAVRTEKPEKGRHCSDCFGE